MDPQEHQDTTTTTVFLVGLGILAGVVALSALSSANKCPRLQTDYNRALRSPGLERELADTYLRDAQQAGCRWARRWPFVEEEA